MNKKLGRLLRPNVVLYFVAMFLFVAGAVYFESYILAAVEAAIIAGLLIWSLLRARKRRKDIQNYVKNAFSVPETANCGECGKEQKDGQETQPQTTASAIK